MADIELWRHLTEHAAEHHGVVSAEEAREFGASYGQLHRLCKSGRLERPVPGTYVLAGSPPTWQQDAMVAAVSAQGWISHRAAAALWRLDGFVGRRVEVLVRHGTRRAQHYWRVHKTRRLGDVDLASVENIPCTAVPRTIIDLAALGHTYEVTKALDDACRQWPEAMDKVAARFRELGGPGRPGTRLLRGILEERLGVAFTQTGFEDITRDLALLVGMPPPVPQCRVTDEAGSMYLDLGWPAVRWAIECDSLAWHSGKQAHERDRSRRRRLKTLGWDVVEVTYDDVTMRATATGEQLLTLYRQREREIGGWSEAGGRRTGC